MLVRVVFHAPYSYIIGKKQVSIEFDSEKAQMTDVLMAIEKMWPVLKEYGDKRFAVSGKGFCDMGEGALSGMEVSHGDTIEVFSPLRGGQAQ